MTTTTQAERFGVASSVSKHELALEPAHTMARMFGDLLRGLADAEQYGGVNLREVRVEARDSASGLGCDVRVTGQHRDQAGSPGMIAVDLFEAARELSRVLAGLTPNELYLARQQLGRDRREVEYVPQVVYEFLAAERRLNEAIEAAKRRGV